MLTASFMNASTDDCEQSMCNIVKSKSSTYCMKYELKGIFECINSFCMEQR